MIKDYIISIAKDKIVKWGPKKFVQVIASAIISGGIIGSISYRIIPDKEMEDGILKDMLTKNDSIKPIEKQEENIEDKER